MSLSLIEQFKVAGQGHVFKFWNELSETEQNNLIEQAGEIDLAEIEELNRTLVKGDGEAHVDYSDLTPAPYIPHPEEGGDSAVWSKAKALGEDALRAGRVAAFVVAGGQGTRLGYDKPKGLFPVSPIKQKSLFQVFAEKIQGAEKRYKSTIPWFIMTSNVNYDDTVSYFKENAFFGLSEEQVLFFKQGRMPAVDLNGKIMLSSKGEIAMSPDGHGGSLRALVRSGAAAKMTEKGIDILSYYQVDNPLIKIIDPTFIGFHIQSESGMSSKMIPKAYPEEKVGVFCTQDDKTVVIEYSDLPAAQTEAVDEKGKLKFIAGSIAIHIISRSFVEQMGGSGKSGAALPFHRADKKIPTVDDSGNPVKSDTPNGIKFEMFVFDALPFSEKTIVIETQRKMDFSPVKNAEGLDSPKTCREDQMKEFSCWLEAAGVVIEKDENGVPVYDLEISPRFAYDTESFLDAWNALSEKPALDAPLYLE